MDQVEDRLELLGIGVGAFLILVGLGTLAGQPWTQTTSTLAAMGQVVGAVLSIGIGGALVWLTHTETEQPTPEAGGSETDETEDAEAV